MSEADDDWWDDNDISDDDDDDDRYETSPLTKGTILQMLWYPYNKLIPISTTTTNTTTTIDIDINNKRKMARNKNTNKTRNPNLISDDYNNFHPIVQVISIDYRTNIGKYHDDYYNTSRNSNNNNNNKITNSNHTNIINNNIHTNDPMVDDKKQLQSQQYQQNIRTFRNKIKLQISDSVYHIDAILLVNENNNENNWNDNEDDDDNNAQVDNNNDDVNDEDDQYSDDDYEEVEIRKAIKETAISKQKIMATIRRSGLQPNMYIKINKFRNVQEVDEINGHMIIIESYTILDDEKYNTQEMILQSLPIGDPDDVNVVDDDDTNIVSLVELIKHTDSCERMSCITCDLSIYGAAHILAEAIRWRNPYIHGLYLKSSDLGDTGIRIIAKAITEHPSIRTLDLQDCQITDSGVQVLCNEVIMKKDRFDKLLLGHNRIGNPGAIHISRLLLLLQNDTLTLQEICLSKSYISLPGVVAIANALKINTSLEVLSFSENNIGDDGIIAIFTALKDNNNNCIKKLDVSETNISNTGISFVADCLKYYCTKLQELRINNNTFDTIGSLTMYTAMQYNTTLQTLLLDKEPDVYYVESNNAANYNNYYSPNHDNNNEDSDNDGDNDSNDDDNDIDNENHEDDESDSDNNNNNNNDDDDSDTTSSSIDIDNAMLLQRNNTNPGINNLPDNEDDSNILRFEDEHHEEESVVFTTNTRVNDVYNDNESTIIWDMLRHNDTVQQIIDSKLPRCFEKILCQQTQSSEMAVWRKEYATKKGSRQRTDIYTWLVKHPEHWFSTSSDRQVKKMEEQLEQQKRPIKQQQEEESVSIIVEEPPSIQSLQQQQQQHKHKQQQQQQQHKHNNKKQKCSLEDL